MMTTTDRLCPDQGRDTMQGVLPAPAPGRLALTWAGVALLALPYALVVGAATLAGMLLALRREVLRRR